MLQNFEKRALAKSNIANLIKSTAGGKIDKNPLRETYTSGGGNEPDTEGDEEAGASDSLTQANILFLTLIAQPEQVTYGTEQQQQQLMDSDCDVLITDGTAAITRAAVKCGRGLTCYNNTSTLGPRRREGRGKYMIMRGSPAGPQTVMGDSPAEPQLQAFDTRADGCIKKSGYKPDGEGSGSDDRSDQQ